MHSIRSTPSSTACPSRSLRRGTAPLELVLSLPIMMFVMALIVDSGTLAPWKVRASSTAREAVWRTHWPHQGGNNPAPAGWPMPGAGYRYSPNSPFSDVTLNKINAVPDILSVDPFAQHSVVRGPTVLPWNQLTVDNTMLDFASGLKQGSSHINLRMPLLPKLDHQIFALQHVLLDNQLQFGPMGYPSNEFRRILLLYGVRDGGTNLTSLAAQYEQAVMNVYQIWSNPFPTDSSPTTSGVLTLDRDDEFLRYENSKPNFHPSISVPTNTRPLCETDREQVRINRVIGPGGIVERIQGSLGQGKGGVPDNMAGVVTVRDKDGQEIDGTGFTGLYLREIQKLKAIRPPPQSQIDALQKKVDQLKQFQKTLN